MGAFKGNHALAGESWCEVFLDYNTHLCLHMAS